MRHLVSVTFLIAIQLGGCVVHNNALKDAVPGAGQTTPVNVIAQDFVNALKQLDLVSPSRTTVDLLNSERKDVFTLAMLGALQQAGYGTRWIDHEGSESLFQYRQESESVAASASRSTYELAVGVVEMRRGYATDDKQRVRPVTPLYIRGADASAVVLNDAIFTNADAKSGQKDSVTAQRRDKPVTSVRMTPIPEIPQAQVYRSGATTLGLQNPSRLKVPTNANPLNPIVGRAAAGPSLSLPLAALQREKNVFDLGASNFNDMLNEHSLVAEQILTFANDSMRLGNRNKLLVERLVKRFDPETDVFSVIGCSMGPTQIKGGNAALALGRAGRVAEALRFAGVDDSRILDEGCWAGDGSLDSLPKRGVVLTLNRHK